MGKLLVIFLFLLIAVWIGWEMHQDSGDVLITFRDWQIETSLWMAALLVVILFIILYILIRVIVRSRHWPRQWRLRRQASRQRRAQQAATLAGCALIEEKWAMAERYFYKAAMTIDQPLLYYVGAAIAAQAQGANARREDYLRKAYHTAPNAEISLGILQAQLQIKACQWPEALATLKKLQSAVPLPSHSPQVIQPDSKHSAIVRT